MNASTIEQGFSKDADAASYDGQADDYGKYVDRLSLPLADFICGLAHLKPGDHVLDVGTGPGVAARKAAQSVAPNGSVVGIDLSAGMIDTAKRSVANWQNKPPSFRLMDAESLDFNDTSFDAVISLSAVAHFPDIVQAIGEMSRVLKPGGRIVVSFGYARPIAAFPLSIHIAKRVLSKVLQPVRPQIVGPDFLTRLAKLSLPEPAQEINTEWGNHDQRGYLLQVVRNHGIEQVEASWKGHELIFDSAEEFWQAQAAIVTEIRKRILCASPETVDRLKHDFLNAANSILLRGGKLIYPYGAYYVSGRRPLG